MKLILLVGILIFFCGCNNIERSRISFNNHPLSEDGFIYSKYSSFKEKNSVEWWFSYCHYLLGLSIEDRGAALRRAKDKLTDQKIELNFLRVSIFYFLFEGTLADYKLAIVYLQEAKKSKNFSNEVSFFITLITNVIENKILCMSSKESLEKEVNVLMNKNQKLNDKIIALSRIEQSIQNRESEVISLDE